MAVKTMPLGVYVLRQFLVDLAAMSTGKGYYFNYPAPVIGPREWFPPETGTVSAPHVWIAPDAGDGGRARPGYGGERAGGAAFEMEDVLEVLVHVATGAEQKNALEFLFMVRADLIRAGITNRKRLLFTGESLKGRPMTFLRRVQFLYPSYAPDMAGVSVQASFTMRWSHSTADQSVE